MAMQRDAPVTAPKPLISSSPRALQGHKGLEITFRGGPGTQRGSEAASAPLHTH